MSSFAHRHLLGIEQLSADDIRFLLDEAEHWARFNRQKRKQDDRLAGLTQFNVFFENSTRTLFSFEVAGKRLGAVVANFHAIGSSVQKGESLIDTALTLDAMQPDVMVIRHSATGAPADVADVVNCAVINAGDGTGEHPTQALLDALTMRRRKGRIEGLKVAICGDIRHSRVAGSNMRLLPRLGAEVRVVGPAALLPDDTRGIPAFTSLDEGIEGADIVMMLRIQRERMEASVSGSLDDFHAQYGLTRERLKRAAPDAVVMHPGPMNRGVEIASDVADDPNRSAILEQVEMGVAMRMAVLDVLTRERRG
ncbi:aspartate carbamoyltransferase catalytic subunit [Sphingosinicella sp. BN140058]|uniref:aspartate carbamoyltransferase catalytic subunit n=1 Tax=Sphingosinicella sp. BN140058 TaxID=1892855 RepID=UPI001010177C|nr:aspartate carbamoyltransferase catalytic subunit [Sphingosinicella sp. BN140058]QAY79248.1 aspartate carbamoyltransferase catalytic subunit [Sphingosinicella sp. BN140058]